MSPVLVGRARELQELEAGLRAARDGSPAAVLVGGEAGVGKTRLINEFQRRTAAAGARLLAGGCLELGTDGLPFAPFTAALRELVRDTGVAGVTELLPAGTARGLGRLLPEFGEPEGEATGEARARLFELVLTLLERLAAAGPTVLIIEDAHWADRSTRDLLAFLLRNLGGGVPLLIVVTYRTDELHRSHPLRPLLTELDRIDRVRRIELGRLRRAEVAELVRGIRGQESEPRLIEEVCARSEGNPLFVEALLGSGGGPADDLPDSLRDLLLAGVQRLPEETQDILRVASGGGARIEHELLAEVAQLSETALTRGLRPAVAANTLVVDGDGYAFRHALIREAIHEDLLPGEHTRLHARYAQALTEYPELMPPRRRAVTLAHHWWKAHDLVQALTSAWEGVLQTRKALAYAEALRLASRVLELWDEVPDAADRIGGTHAEVLETAVAMADRGGETETGVKLATAALAEIDDPMRAAHLYERRGRMLGRLGHPEAIEDLRTAARIAPADPPNVTRSRALATLTIHLDALHGTREESQAAAEEGLAIARAVGDVPAEIMVSLHLAWVGLFRDDDPEAFLAMVEQARVRAEEIRAYDPLMRTYINRSDVLEAYGRHEEAAEVARRGIERSQEYGLARTSGAFLAINLAEPLISLGHWDEALEVIGRAVAHDPPNVMRAGLEILAGGVAEARGDVEAAERAATTARGLIGRGAVRRAQELFPVSRLDALVLLARGRPREALDALGPVFDDHELPDDSRYALPALVVAATACADLGDAAPLPRIRDRAAGIRIYGPMQEAHRLTLLAEAARADGRGGDDSLDRPGWEAAVKAWDTLGQPYESAWTRTRAAAAAIAGGDRDGAAVLLREAAAAAGRLGAVPLREQIDELARRARVPLGAGPAAEAPRLGLTPRETEVLRLVAEGRSNREIAEALFISAKTASVHVSNILTKLDVSSRGAAAAAAHRLHLFDQP